LPDCDALYFGTKHRQYIYWYCAHCPTRVNKQIGDNGHLTDTQLPRVIIAHHVLRFDI